MNRIVKPAEIRREEILDCALRLFSQQGYDATSVNQIIAALGLSKGAFYHHFAAKQDLIEALAVRFADDAARMATPVLEDESLDAFSRLSKFLASMRQSKVNAAFEVRNTFEPLFRPENAALFDRVQQAMFGVVRPILARIIADGVAERTFDTGHPDLAAETIMLVLGSTRKVVTDLYAARNDADLDAAAAELLERYDYMGTVVDRILGLPEGSIVLSDCETIMLVLGSTRKVVTDLYAARNDADLDAAAAELLERYDYMGTVVDRILGLPEGSIVLSDCETIRVMIDAWRREKSAA